MTEIPKRRQTWSKRVDPTLPASRIIDLFGGLTRFCQETKVPTSTAWSWAEKGFIPTDWQGHVRFHAKRLRIALPPQMFVPEPALHPKFADAA